MVVYISRLFNFFTVFLTSIVAIIWSWIPQHNWIFPFSVYEGISRFSRTHFELSAHLKMEMIGRFFRLFYSRLIGEGHTWFMILKIFEGSTQHWARLLWYSKVRSGWAPSNFKAWLFIGVSMYCTIESTGTGILSSDILLCSDQISLALMVSLSSSQLQSVLNFELKTSLLKVVLINLINSWTGLYLHE